MTDNVPYEACNYLFSELALNGSKDTVVILFYFFLSITNKMQCYTLFFITVNALHVSGGFTAHHQELKNCTHSIRYMSSLLAGYC